MVLLAAVARELEQVVDDVRRAEGLLLHLAQQVVARVVLRGVGEQHLGVRGDAGDRRVDLVRDARGEHAEGGEPLLLLERVLHRHAVGDVVHHHHLQVALGAAAGGERHLQVPLAPAGVAVAHLAEPLLGVGQRLERQQVHQAAAVDRGLVDARETREGAVARHHPPRTVEHHDAGGGGLEDLVAVLLEPGDLVELVTELLEQARVLQGEGGLVEGAAQQVELLAVERVAVMAAAGEQQRHRPLAYGEREGVAVAALVEQVRPHRPQRGQRRRGELDGALLPQLGLEDLERQLRHGLDAALGVAAGVDQPVAVDQVERHVGQPETLGEPLLEALAQPRQVALLEQLTPQLAQRAALREAAAVLPALDAGAHPPLGRHQHGGDGEPGDERERAARQRHLVREPAADGEVEQREADDAEQQGQRVRGGAPKDDLEVPEAEAEERPAEGDRHQGEGHHRRGGRPRRHLQVQGPGHAVEQGEGQVARGDADRQPLQLAPLLPVGAAGELGCERAEGGEREETEERDLQAVEDSQGGPREAAEEQAAVVEHEVRLQSGEGHRRQVEEGHQAPPLARGPERAGEDEEEVQGQGRQEEAPELLDGVARLRQGVLGARDAGAEVDGGRRQRPEEEEPRRRAPGVQEGVDPEPEVQQPGERQHQVGAVDAQRRPLVVDVDQLGAAQDGEAGDVGREQALAQLTAVARRGAADEQDAVPLAQAGLRGVHLGDEERPGARRGVDAGRAEALHLAHQVDRTERAHEDGQDDGGEKAQPSDGDASLHRIRDSRAHPRRKHATQIERRERVGGLGAELLEGRPRGGP